MYKAVQRIQAFVEGIHEIVDDSEKGKINEDIRIVLQELHLEVQHRYGIKTSTFRTIAKESYLADFGVTNGLTAFTSAGLNLVPGHIGRKISFAARSTS